MTIHTIGYSNKTIHEFINKLRESEVTLVLDVRSRPFSRNPQFNRPYLERTLRHNGIEYLFMGDCLGGLETNFDFNEAISEVIRLSEIQNLVLMCVEKDPKKCHRYQQLTPEIEKFGYEVKHLLWE